MATHPKTAEGTAPTPGVAIEGRLQTIGLDKVRSKLAWLWLGGAGFIVTILVVQSLMGKYGSGVQEVWGWALPNLVPTLGMIITVLGYTALDPERSKFEVRADFYRIAFTLSVAYLFLVALTILIQPMTPYEPLQLMRMANLWLGPCQGLVASALGVLFVSKKLPRH